jgi:hypothetical protein
MKKILRKLGKFIPAKLMLYIDYGRSYRKILNLKNPQYFGEKIQWMKLYGNLDRYSKYVDKYEVRKFIKERIGEKYLTALYGIYNNPADINFNEFPQRFVIKSTSGSGGNIICKDKTKLDINKTIKILNKWIKIDYYKYTKEMQYKNIEPRIICEEYLEDESGSLRDYKFHCSAGNIFMIEVHSNRFSGDKKENYYDTNWNDYGIVCKVGKVPFIEKPKNLDEMKIIAQKLSKDFRYVRVDLYCVNNKIYFGELTFTPANGTDPHYPLEKDLELAKNIQI